MINIKTILITIGLATILGYSVWQQNSSDQAQLQENSEKENVIVYAVNQYINKFHFNPKQVNDSTSSKMFDLYINRLDGAKRFLTKDDVSKLEPWRYKIDDQIKNNQTVFFDESVKVIKKAIKRARGIYNEAVEEPFDFTKKEDLQTDQDKLEFPTDEEELQELWRKYIKSDVLSRISNKLDKQEAENYSGEKKSLDSIKAEAVSKTKETFEKWWSNMDKTRRIDWLSTYVNAFTNVFDPHTGFFKPKDKEDFDMRMSNSLEGIGAQLTMDGNYVKVVKLIPGGPAWKQKDLKADDLILKVEQEDEEAVDVVGMHIDDVVSKIRGEKGTYVTLHVKHVDGTQEEIKIERDVVIFEQGYAKSYILEDSVHKQKVGYIDLPSFYADFDDKSARSSSSDMKKEIEKLKSNNVNGVILDLRSNGGGSLRDVVDIAGLFVEEGPMVQVKSRKGDPYILEDEDPKVVYDGPLIILVNQFSASASEIMAAAMQDYGRGVIVGANTTFGKGTVQRFYSLDKGLRGHDEVKPLGSVKVTTQKYFRVDGGSVQLRGVTPDIVLPGRYNQIDVGEKAYDYAMKWTEIPSVEYSQDVMNYDIPYLQDKSKKRISSSEQFQIMQENADYIEELKENSTVSLNLEEFREKKKEQEEKKQYFKKENQRIQGVAVKNMSQDWNRIEKDSVKIDRNKAIIERIEKDLYVDEALNVMNDILHPEMSARNK